MREILFRGKRKTDGEWVFGMPWIFKDHACICPWKEGMCKYDTGFYPVHVDPKTVGQFTGLTDKNGKRIFEGDIICSDNGKQRAVSVIKFGEYYPKMFYKMLDMFSPGRKHIPAHGFFAVSVDQNEEMIVFQSRCVTVIGNIHDNPELLGGER